jgi:hypothetical protein
VLQKELEDYKHVVDQYESEIVDLNKNLKSLKKTNSDQQQLYEVRVNSQEQEIEQHQIRYSELEHQQKSEIKNHEERFSQLQN